ncbi:MAG: hypothetical protein ABIG39_03745 [Candidatus Micrarchaeota archaeon]
MAGEGDDSGSSEKKIVVDTNPRIIPGSINITALEQALTIDDAGTRLDKIFEIALEATPNDETSPIGPKDTVRSNLNGPVKEMDELIPKISSTRRRREKNHDEATRTLDDLNVQFESLHALVFEGKEPVEKLKAEVHKEEEPAPQQNTHQVETAFKRQMATSVLTWHLGSRQIDNQAKVKIIEAAADVVINTVIPVQLLEQAATVTSSDTTATRDSKFDSLLKLCKNNPVIKESTEFRDRLAAILGSSALPSDSTGAVKAAQILAELGGEKSVAVLSELLDAATDKKRVQHTGSEEPSPEEPRVLPTAVIESLGRIGADAPKSAVRALKKAKSTDKGIGENVSTAISSIISATTAHNKTPFSDSKELWLAMDTILKAEGVGWFSRKRVKSKILDERMTSTEQLVRMATEKMGSRHPIWNRRGEKIFKGVRNMQHLKGKMGTLVGYGQVRRVRV